MKDLFDYLGKMNSSMTLEENFKALLKNFEDLEQ